MKPNFILNRFWSLAFLCSFALGAFANNITVTNVSLVSVNTNAGTLQIKFDLAWENSWRVTAPPANWDAAWVFAKYQGADGVWRHCSLSANNGDHIVPAGATLQVGLTGAHAVGAFIYRSVTGSGTVSWPNVRLQWNYASDGVRNSDLVSVDVAAIEMVYVPSGAFYVGDGASSNRFQYGSDGTAPYLVSGSGTITLNDTAGSLWVNGASNSLRGAVITAPNGFNAFYCMKYECSQGQLASFLNKTSRTNKPLWRTTRSVFTGALPLIAASTPDRATISTDEEALAYMDWAGLRPMTDLEYEKACRGPLSAFGNEYAWGNALRAPLAYTLTGDGTPTERVVLGYDTHFGNTWDTLTCYGTPQFVINLNTNNGTIFPVPYGPCRVGMFALQSYASGAPARTQSGATYWGIMDMTGNIGEPVYPIVGSNSITTYSGTHGDGNLSLSRLADVAGWPTNSLTARGGGVDLSFDHWTTAQCGPSLFCGWSYYAAVGLIRAVSDRTIDLRYRAEFPSYRVGGNFSNPQPDSIGAFGIRGVRSAP